MSYRAEISRTNPALILLTIDQSGSMEDPFGEGPTGRSKADSLADAINRLLQNLVIKCTNFPFGLTPSQKAARQCVVP